MAKTPYKFIRIAPKILGVEFRGKNAAKHMALMFMRLQEFSEGIEEIRGKFLTEGDTLIAYLNKHNKLYYADGTVGFNITSATFYAAFGIHNWGIRWNKYEDALIEEISSPMSLGDNFTVIAWLKGDKATRQHEMCHAFFFLDLDYRQKVANVLKKVDLSKAKKFLRNHGYHITEYILFDETNAYAVTDKPSVVKKLGLSKKTLKELQKLYKRYVK